MKIFRNISFFIFCFIFFNSAQSQVNFLEKAKHFSELDSSIVYAEKQLDVSYSNFDSSSIIETSLFLAHAYTSKSQYSKAEKIVKDGLAIAIFKKNKISEALFNQELANINKFEGKTSTALRLYLQTSEIFEKLEDWKDLSACYVDIAEFYRKIGKYDDAKIYIKNAAKLYQNKQINDLPLYIRIANRTAAIYNEINMQDSSIFYSRKALLFSRQIKDKNSEAISLNELGFSFKNLGELDTAISCYIQAEQLWFSMGADREAVNAMNNRAMLYSHNSYPSKQLIEFYLKLINIVESRKIDYRLNSTFYELHLKYLFAGDTANAFKYFLKYHVAVSNDFARSKEVEINKIKEKYENEKIKGQMEDVSEKLTRSQLVLEQEKHENFIISISLAVSLFFAILIFYLLRQVKKKNKTLHQKNIEKDALIQEIHHRVKNNLQFVSSLINMQINASINNEEIYSLNDASRRIRAMSLVHEMLYNHAEINGVPIRQYLNELLESINELVNSDEIPIEFDLQIEEMIFDTSKSIALGMITSELVSNAIKYAFKDNRRPKINISLKRDVLQNKIEFIVKDNGRGFIEVKDDRKKLGMRLIGIFSRQVKGDFKFENENGLKYTLTFKYN